MIDEVYFEDIFDEFSFKKQMENLATNDEYEKNIDILKLALDVEEGKITRCPSCNERGMELVSGCPLIMNLSHTENCLLEPLIYKWIKENNILKRWCDNKTFGIGKYKK